MDMRINLRFVFSKVIILVFIAFTYEIDAQVFTTIEYSFPGSNTSSCIKVQEYDKYYLYQGDIRIEKNNEKLNFGERSNLWSCGIIPYSFDPSISSFQSSIILQAINEINSKTNISLVPRTNEVDYVTFKTISGSTCSSSLGVIGGQQFIFVTSGACSHWTSVAHEIYHAAGFRHEQSRSDRDSHVQIHWNNITSGFESQFEIDSESTVHGSYDFGSIMHYHPYTFSKNGNPTITALNGQTIGHNNELSPNDILFANVVYPTCSNFEPNLTYTSVGNINVLRTNIQVTNLTIKNTGNTSSSAFRVGLYLSDDATITKHDKLVGSNYFNSLNSNQAVNISFNRYVDIEVPEGLYYVGFLIDDTNLVSESIEKDNRYTYTNPKFLKTLPFCLFQDIFLSGSLGDNSFYRVSGKITSNASLNSGRKSTFQAKSEINLLNGFLLNDNTTFEAQIVNCSAAGQLVELAQDLNHVITYQEIGDEIQFVIDCIGDKTDNRSNATTPDFAKISFDFDQNSSITGNVDGEFSAIHNDQPDLCNYHFFYNNGQVFVNSCNSFPSTANFQSAFTSSSYESDNHIIYIFNIPKIELGTGSSSDIVFSIFESASGFSFYPANSYPLFSNKYHITW